MIVFEINYSEEALQDLRSIYAYIALEQLEPIIAEDVIKTIREYIYSLMTLPLRHKVVDWSPWKESGIRSFVVKKHAIFYQAIEEEKRINIIRIISCKRNVPDLLL